MKKAELTPHEIDLIYTDSVLLADAFDIDLSSDCLINPEDNLLLKDLIEEIAAINKKP